MPYKIECGIKIIYEDENILAVHKPAGINVHVDSNYKEGTLIQKILEKYPQMHNVGDAARPGVAHRLDRDTSGVLILAKNAESFDYLKNLFKNHLIKKTYIALLQGKLGKKIGERGIIELPIARSAKNPILRIAKGKTRGELKSALTEYKILKHFYLKNLNPDSTRSTVKFTLIEAYPKTGRTHQIRAHFKALDAPVAGDKLYGNKKINEELKLLGLARQFLHAVSLEFTLQNNGRIKIEVDLADDLKSFLDKLQEER